MYDNLFEKYYADQALYGFGVSPTFYRSSIFQRGSGVNHGAFSSILKSALRLAKPAAKFIGKKAIRAAGDTASKMIDGKSFGQSLSEVGADQYDRVKKKYFQVNPSTIACIIKTKTKTTDSSPAAAKASDQKKEEKAKKKNIHLAETRVLRSEASLKNDIKN